MELKKLFLLFWILDFSNDDLITGVNFASAGSGFDDSTSIFSQANPVSKQIELFRNYIERLKGIVGEEKALKIIHSALVILSAGTNDWFFNFYDIPARRLHFNVSGYQDFLLDKIHSVAKVIKKRVFSFSSAVNSVDHFFKVHAYQSIVYKLSGII